jgi:hypothetical protein
MAMLRIPLEKVSFFGQTFAKFDLKKMISTYIKDFSWKK